MQSDYSGSGRRSISEDDLPHATAEKSRSAGSHGGLLKRSKDAKLQHAFKQTAILRCGQAWSSN